MKKQEKGFTLIELLAVIVILAIIALIAVPVIMNIISNANKSAFKDSAYGIIKAGELYYSEKLLEVDGMKEDVTFTFPEASGLELKGSKPTSGNMKVSKEGKVALAISNGKYCIRKGLDDVDITIDENIADCNLPKIITSDSNCIKEGICSNGTKVNVKVNSSENYDFYVIDDDGENLTLIMDRNLGGKVAWYIDSSDNSKGPLTALDTLEMQTASWTNIPTFNYTYIDDKPDAWGNTVRYEPITRTSVRARLLSYKEATVLGCEKDTGTCPRWLYGDLVGSTTETAFWLSATLSNSSSYVWIVSQQGFVCGYYTNYVDIVGVRPVISVPKNL